MDSEKTKVIFRKFSNGEVLALFPEIVAVRIGYLCQSYIHVGQHGAADPSIVYRTKLAKPDEYKDLYKELTDIGYNLKVIKRFNKKHLQIRQAMYSY